jgi:hypothetical protein
VGKIICAFGERLDPNNFVRFVGLVVAERDSNDWRRDAPETMIVKDRRGQEQIVVL